MYYLWLIHNIVVVIRVHSTCQFVPGFRYLYVYNIDSGIYLDYLYTVNIM